MPRAGPLGCLLLFVVLAGGGYWFGQGYVRDNPEKFPWTDLDLRDPVGPFTRAKLVSLTNDRARCVALLGSVDPSSRTVETRPTAEPMCAFEDAIRLAPRSNEDPHYAPALTTACPVAAALALWMREAVQPAASAQLGSRVARIENFGSFSCRRRYNRPDAGWSEHATGDAVDISAFVLTDGRRISVLSDWPEGGPEAAFLRQSRDGACALFTTVLSPDYNAAHRDHLHLDMAEGGAAGWHLCR